MTGPLRFQLTILVLVMLTAAIHLSRARADPEIGLLFTLNAVGYLLLVALLYLPLPGLRRWCQIIRWLLIGYTAVTIGLYLLWGALSSEWSTLGWIDKVIEGALLGLLWWEARHAAP
jgi:hypothetical protein